MLAHGISGYEMFPRRQAILLSPDDNISYPDMVSGWKTLTKVSKPCYNPRSSALQWCVRTPCPGILLGFWIFLWQRTSKLWLFMFLSFPLICHGFQITLINLRFALVIKKLSKHQNLTHFLLELIVRVLTMLIGLKGDNYYSKVFKRVNYKLSNSTF